jgi:hypothetical protein
MTATLTRPAVPATKPPKRRYRLLALAGALVVGLLVGSIATGVVTSANASAKNAACVEALNLVDKGFSATSASEYIRTIEPRYNYTKASATCRG